MKRKSLLITISIALLAGCNSISSLPVETATQGRTIASITPTIINTIAPILLTETSTPSIPTEITSNDIVQNCLEIDDKEILLNEIANHGTVVVGGAIDESPYLLDLQTGLRYDLPLNEKVNGGYLGLHTSPDGKSLAYIEDIQNAEKYIIKQKIWVVDAEGRTLVSQIINPEVLHTDDWGWLDNERFQFGFKSITPTDGTVVIYSPFKDEWQYVSNNLPNFYKFYDLDPSWWLVNYNSDLKWVIYMGVDDEFRSGPILRDVELQKVIWQSIDSSATIKIPRWSPSGSEIAVASGGYLYFINRGGETKATPDLGADSEIMGFTWSPDGNYIALLVRYYQPQLKGYLMLYDVRKNKIVDYCIESDNLMGVRPPVWSLNSELVSFEIITMKDDGPRDTLIVLDIQNNVVYRILESMQPLAWMNSIP